MDQVFESFMTELREEYGEEESISTGLCQKNSEPKKVTQSRPASVSFVASFSLRREEIVESKDVNPPPRPPRTKTSI